MNSNAFINSCREFANQVNKKYPVTIAYLFGSRAQNTDNAMSDIDIALLFSNNYNSMDDVFIRGDII